MDRTDSFISGCSKHFSALSFAATSCGAAFDSHRMRIRNPCSLLQQYYKSKQWARYRRCSASASLRSCSGVIISVNILSSTGSEFPKLSWARCWTSMSVQRRDQWNTNTHTCFFRWQNDSPIPIHSILGLRASSFYDRLITLGRDQTATCDVTTRKLSNVM